MNYVWMYIFHAYLLISNASDIYLGKFRKWEYGEGHDDADGVRAEEGGEELGEGDGQPQLGPQQDEGSHEITWNKIYTFIFVPHTHIWENTMSRNCNHTRKLNKITFWDWSR